MNRDQRQLLGGLSPEQEMMRARQIFGSYLPYYSGPGQVNWQAYQVAATSTPPQADWAAYLAQLGTYQRPQFRTVKPKMDWLTKPSLMDPRSRARPETGPQDVRGTQGRPNPMSSSPNDQESQNQSPFSKPLPTPPHEWFNGFGPIPAS